MFHDPAGFDFTVPLERHWREIHREYLAIREQAVEWMERKLHDSGWKVYGLYGFPFGAPLEANVARCPLTASLVSEHVPRHGAAGFSILEPGTEIRPHQGYQGDFLRLHLALSVPAGDCALRVGEEVRSWREGRVLVFDDRVTHEAWNRTAGERVVLLVDFVPDGGVIPPAGGSAGRPPSNG
jgi:beta-hydroxylase